MNNIYSKEKRLDALKLADEIGPVATKYPTPKTEKELREEVLALQKQLKERNEEVEILRAALVFLPDGKTSENTVHKFFHERNFHKRIYGKAPYLLLFYSFTING